MDVMKSKSRTENAAKNALIVTICQIFSYIINFVNRTIFIRLLGVVYLGVSGLFTNILTLLSFAELGIGHAITFHLYKPLAEKDEIEINKLLKLYSTIYKFIGAFILIAGLIFIPFIKYIITDAPDIPESLNLIYVLLLINSAVSYFFSYKSTILIADQKNYIVSFRRQVITVIFMIINMFVLYFTKSYILYLILQIIMTLTINISISIKANKVYPFIKNANKSNIEKTKVKSIFKDVKALMMYKLSEVVINGADNIILSVMMGVIAVGYVSNYTMITLAITNILYQMVNSLTASIGNLNAENDKQRSENVFNKIFFLCFWIYSMGSIMLLVLLNDFMYLWLGDMYVLEYMVVVGLVFNFYIKGIQLPSYMYRMSLGLYVQGRYAPVVSAILNIILSIGLCKLIGIGGIFMATAISKMLTSGIVDPFLIYKYKFEKNVTGYFKTYFKYALVFFGIFAIVYLITHFLVVNNIFTLLLKAIIAFISFNIIFIFIFRKNQYYIECKEIIKNLIGKKLKRRSI